MRWIFKVYFVNGNTAEFEGTTSSLYHNVSFNIYDGELLIASFAIDKIAGYSVQESEVKV